MKRVALIALPLLASCNQGPDFDTAHKRYLMMVANRAPREDLCAEDKRNAKVALDALNEREYKGWLQMEQEDCTPPEMLLH